MKWLATWIMNWIARDGSSDWALAMRCEFEELKRGHLHWALGCSFALLKEKVKRESAFIAALILLPLASLATGTAVTLGIYYVFLRDSGLPHMVMSLPSIIIQLPFAALLGLARPSYMPLLIGALGFISQQIVPQILFSALFDAPFHFWWGPNVTIYNMTPAMGYACSIAMWLIGAHLGAGFARARLAR